MLLIINGVVTYREYEERIDARRQAAIKVTQREFADYCSENSIVADNIWYTEEFIFVVTTDNWICQHDKFGTVHYDPHISQPIIMLYYSMNYPEKIVLTSDGAMWLTIFPNNKPMFWQRVKLQFPITSVCYLGKDRIVRIRDQQSKDRWLSIGDYPQGEAPDMSPCQEFQQFHLIHDNILYALTNDHELVVYTHDQRKISKIKDAPKSSSIFKYFKHSDRELVAKDVAQIGVSSYYQVFEEDHVFCQDVFIVDLHGKLSVVECCHCSTSYNAFWYPDKLIDIETPNIINQIVQSLDHNGVIVVDIDNKSYCINSKHQLVEVEVDPEDHVIIPNTTNYPLISERKSARVC